jgi:rhamnosyltransferase
MTQDAIPQNNYLIKNLISPLNNPEIVASYARHIPKEDASPTEAFARYFNYPDKAIIKGIENLDKLGIKTFFFSNSCSAIKRNIFFEVGMFPEDLKSNEDMIIAAKMILKGYKIAYVPDAIVVHSHNYNLTDLFKRYYNIGASLNKNKWILKYVKTEKEGVRFLNEQLKFIFKRNDGRYIPSILIEASVKYLAYKIGLIIG